MIDQFLYYSPAFTVEMSPAHLGSEDDWNPVAWFICRQDADEYIENLPADCKTRTLYRVRSLALSGKTRAALKILLTPDETH